MNITGSLRHRPEENIGKKYRTNSFGMIIVLAYTGRNEKNVATYAVRFINTGYEKYGVRFHDITRGAIKDPYAKTKLGVGCIGDSEKSGSKLWKTAMSCWGGMMKRCYSQKNKDYHNYGAKGVRVCEEWLVFANFYSWYEKNHISGFHLDKDKLSGAKKVYSPETCCFLSPAENSLLARAIEWKVITPSKNEMKVYNLKEFCRENSLSYGCAKQVARGLRSHHKGFKFSYAN